MRLLGPAVDGGGGGGGGRGKEGDRTAGGASLIAMGGVASGDPTPQCLEWWCGEIVVAALMGVP